MKLHNPFDAAIRYQSTFLILSIYVVLCLFVAAFAIVLIVYPVFIIPIVAGIAIGRVVYAIIKGK